MSAVSDYCGMSALEFDAYRLGWGAETIVVLMDGYFDESGEHEGQTLKRLTLGGFFAPWPAIAELTKEWRKALDDECLGAFHMKEFASDEHNYLAWGAERKQRLDRFVDILCCHAGEFHAYSYVPVSSNESAFKDTYETALNRVFISSSTLAERTGERGRVIFAQTQEISAGRVGAYFDANGWAEYLERWEVVQSKCEPALQAAEIVARGWKRYMQDGTITHSFFKVLSSGKTVRTWPESFLYRAR